MANTTLNQDKQRFAEWRSQRQSRQPIPDALWHLACHHISTLGISRVAREFRLNDTKLREKALQVGIAPAKPGQLDLIGKNHRRQANSLIAYSLLWLRSLT